MDVLGPAGTAQRADADSIPSPGAGAHPSQLMSDADPTDAVAALARRHPEIAAARERHGPPFTGSRPEPSDRFALLVRSIVGQQISVAAADAILARVVSTLPGPVAPAAFLEADTEQLRSAGLSGAKVQALKALSDACTEGGLDLARLEAEGEDDVRRGLCAIRGIGPWTADMFLMFGLRHPDVWPVGDVAMRRGYARLHNLAEIPDAAAITPRGDAYRPFRSIAAWYCWAEIDADPQGSSWN